MTTTIQLHSLPSFAAHAVAQPMPFAPRRPVRVCFLIDELTNAGTETQLLALIRGLDPRRVQPYLCLLRGQSELSRALEPDQCPVARLQVGSLRNPATLIKAWRFAWFLRRENIDILQVYFPDSTYFGVPLAWLARVPRIVRTRNNLGYWMTPWHRGLGRMCNRLTDALVANCDAARETVMNDEGMESERVVVLENGVDLSRFRSSEPRDPTLSRRVGVVANLRPVKGLDTFVRAASILKSAHPNLTFHIAGEGPLRPNLESMARERALGDRIVWEGSVTDIPRFLAGLDVTVLPSRSEGMSNALLEYMAAGKAIVATSVGGNSQLIENGIHGLLVPPDDPDALSAAVGHLLNDSDFANRLGQAARWRVEERFSREAMLRRFESFYVSLIGAQDSQHHTGKEDTKPARRNSRVTRRRETWTLTRC
jgi:glycosyltransferase involved in cell wall biosynthesis